MTRRGNAGRLLACAVLLASMAAVPLTAHAQPNATEPELETGLKAGISLFKSLRETWSQEIVEPLARTQATRALRQLSNALDDLALQKQELADAVLLAAEKNDFGAVHLEAERLRDEVFAVRRRLNRVFKLLPPTRQQEGGKIEAQLQLGMSTKWESMTAIAKELALPSPTAAELRERTKEMVLLTQAMKAQVDSLVVGMQASTPR